MPVWLPSHCCGIDCGAVAERIVKRLLLLLLVPLFFPVPVLEVGAEGDSHTWVTSLREQARVTVGYVHSVEQTWVEEAYEASRDGVRLRTMKWQSFGAGLPDEYDYYEDGFYVKELELDMGPSLSYWFLPLNRVEICVDERVVFRGPEQPSRVNARVCRMPLAGLLVSQWLQA